MLSYRQGAGINNLWASFSETLQLDTACRLRIYRLLVSDELVDGAEAFLPRDVLVTPLLDEEVAWWPGTRPAPAQGPAPMSLLPPEMMPLQGRVDDDNAASDVPSISASSSDEDVATVRDVMAAWNIRSGSEASDEEEKEVGGDGAGTVAPQAAQVVHVGEGAAVDVQPPAQQAAPAPAAAQDAAPRG